MRRVGSLSVLSQPRLVRDFREKLLGWHRILSSSLEAVVAAEFRFEISSERLWALILQDDLAELLMECEALLLTVSDVTASEFLAFENRSETVLEEAETILLRWPTSLQSFEESY